jgi:hypothetical protein
MHKDEDKCIKNDTFFDNLFDFYIICSLISTLKIIKIHKIIFEWCPLLVYNIIIVLLSIYYTNNVEKLTQIY